MLDTEQDALHLLEFEMAVEDSCEIINQTGCQCDSPALYRVILTCLSHHTRAVLMCARDLDIAQHDELACIACDKVGGFELAEVLAFTPIKK